MDGLQRLKILRTIHKMAQKTKGNTVSCRSCDGVITSSIDTGHAEWCIVAQAERVLGDG